MAGRHRQVRPRSTSRGRHRNPPPRGRLVLPSLAAAAVLGVGGVGATAALTAGHDVHTLGDTTPTPAPTLALVQPTPTATVAPASAATSRPTPAALPRDKRFILTVTGKVVWVSVVAPHNHVLYAGFMHHGQKLQTTQRPLRVVIGDGGAVKLVLRAVHDPLGRRGSVWRFTLR